MTLPDRIIYKAEAYLSGLCQFGFAFLNSARPEYLFSWGLFELVPSVHSDIARPWLYTFRVYCWTGKPYIWIGWEPQMAIMLPRNIEHTVETTVASRRPSWRINSKNPLYTDSTIFSNSALFEQGPQVFFFLHIQLKNLPRKLKK